MNKKKSRRNFSNEFKKEIVSLITKEGRRPSERARDFDLHRTVIDRWGREFSGNGKPSDTTKKISLSAEEEIQHLKQELASVKEDREILKKALAFFSRHSK